jgi:MFS family permease
MGILSWSRSLPRDLRLLFFSLFLWTFGLGIYNYVWSLYLTQLSANPEQVGLVSSIGFFAAAISMIPGGILANKYDNRTLLIIGWAMSIPVPILFYFSRTWSDVIPGLIILQLSAFNVPAMNAFISALGDQKRMSSAFGAVYSAFPLGLVLSPAVGSLLLTWLSIRDLFWFTLALWTVSTIILFHYSFTISFISRTLRSSFWELPSLWVAQSSRSFSVDGLPLGIQGQQ